MSWAAELNSSGRPPVWVSSRQPWSTGTATSAGHQSKPGVHLADREQPQLDGGDHAEAAAAAAQRPEQVRVGAGIGAQLLEVGGDDLDRLDVVRGQPVGAARLLIPPPIV